MSVYLNCYTCGTQFGEFERHVCRTEDLLSKPLRDRIAELEERVAYWRDVVKNSPESVDIGIHNYSAECVFCGAIRNGEGLGPHNANCPWKLAQEETTSPSR